MEFNPWFLELKATLQATKHSSCWYQNLFFFMSHIRRVYRWCEWILWTKKSVVLYFYYYFFKPLAACFFVGVSFYYYPQRSEVGENDSFLSRDIEPIYSSNGTEVENLNLDNLGHFLLEVCGYLRVFWLFCFVLFWE